MFYFFLFLIFSFIVLYKNKIITKQHLRKIKKILLSFIRIIFKIIFFVIQKFTKTENSSNTSPFTQPKYQPFSPSMNNFPIKSVLITVLSVIALVVLNPFVTIDVGNKGVIFDKLQDGIQVETLDEGLHFKIPFFQKITQIPIRTQKIVFSNDASGKYIDGSNTYQQTRLTAASSDLQDVYVDAVVTYHIDSQKVSKVFQEVGSDYAQKKIIPKVADSVKTFTAKFKVSEILTKREEIKIKVFDDLQKNLLQDNIILEDINLVNFDFNAQFKNAIEQKQIEEQKAEKEKYILQQIEISSQQKVKEAEAEKQAKILEGEGIAEYNKLIQQEITENVLQYKALENQKTAISQWNGIYPQTYLGSGENSPIPLINIGNK